MVVRFFPGVVPGAGNGCFPRAWKCISPGILRLNSGFLFFAPAVHGFKPVNGCVNCLGPALAGTSQNRRARNMPDQTFPRELRLRNSSDFARIRKEGRSYPGRFILLNVLRHPGRVVSDLANVQPFKAEDSAGCLGVITSRKVGCAVVRNRVRRYVREVFRRDKTQLNGCWVVVVAKRTAAEATFEGIAKDWGSLGRRSGILK